MLSGLCKPDEGLGGPAFESLDLLFSSGSDLGADDSSSALDSDDEEGSLCPPSSPSFAASRLSFSALSDGAHSCGSTPRRLPSADGSQSSDGGSAPDSPPAARRPGCVLVPSAPPRLRRRAASEPPSDGGDDEGTPRPHGGGAPARALGSLPARRGRKLPVPELASSVPIDIPLTPPRAKPAPRPAPAAAAAAFAAAAAARAGFLPPHQIALAEDIFLARAEAAPGACIRRERRARDKALRTVVGFEGRC
ncbi:hypothetical protein Rsub_07001 [Raphidocelis subcapitata]|uniref:Uncharacterized protein n=1 Tax=Raphidocelis subcapitata TaxID=307507 RepID=A0A2V0PBC7_9CHLO|nr:hypothetical protein Rsub_07001 [Raphidocelis subcapitata]|eukprot:GBF94467.1 hypothetical protein Rsub_07001 [Raphidocelis subcapitata]